jgi:putative peptidoglycan lipid II flippase
MALSISVAMTANFLFLGAILHRKLRGFSLSYLLTGLGKVLAAAFVMGLSLYALDLFLRDWMQGGFIRELFGVLFSVVSGAYPLPAQTSGTQDTAGQVLRKDRRLEKSAVIW